ncbi:hypothetical protein SS50377_20166 [Spironucleus salmonicida]|uniref:Uncharacterized protein n=1 Tax=Spironucleus salmonicida TaxID=348837 RepID=V6LNC9_9EUKA|nr:hypothetical protein SS50377_20166 [Spironucleus salmonicida]|eukprot:EST45221.1 Hypothetical protein SS50377_14796 [Spironucleus salmonicida]
MKFSLQVILKINQLIFDNLSAPLTGIFYGTEDISYDFVKCDLTETAMLQTDQNQMKSGLSFLRTAVFAFNCSNLIFKGEQYSVNAKQSGFDLKKAEDGKNGLIFDKQEAEILIDELEENCMRLILADQSAGEILQ